MSFWNRHRVALSGASLLLLCASCGTAKGEQSSSALVEAKKVTAPSSATRWQAVEPAGESAWLDAPAKVISSPNDTAMVTAPLAARVQRVRVHAGQVVREGDALVDVVMPELIRAAGALRSADLRLASWQDRRNIVAPLLEKGLARAAELSEVDANIAAVRGDRENARATLRAAGETDGRAAALLDANSVVSLRAPIAGVVVSVMAKVGEVREPSAGPLVELVTQDADPRIEARFSTPPPLGASFAWVESARALPLTLEMLSPHADERDGSRMGWLRVADAKETLVAGTLGRVQVRATTNWALVPARALREENGTFSVELKTADGSRRAPVTLIQRSATDALVEGLTPNAQVAADVSRLAETGP